MPAPDVDQTPSLPLACDLGPQDGEARLLRWQALHRGATPTAHLRDGELEVRYPSGPGVHEELVALADAEQECCSFVRWSVTEVAGRAVLRVTALADFLVGGFGTPEDEYFVVVWVNSDAARNHLGYTETARRLRLRLSRCHPSNREWVARDLADAGKAWDQQSSTGSSPSLRNGATPSTFG